MQEDILENVDLETNNLLLFYDKEISSLETKMYNEYFENLSSDKLVGEVEVPLVNTQDSEISTILRIKHHYASSKHFLQRQIEFPERYFVRDISEALKDVDVSGDKRQQMVDLMIELKTKENEKKIKKIEAREEQLEKEPKWILRYMEFYEGNYEAIENLEIKRDLYEQKEVLLSLKAKREKVLETLHTNEKKKKNCLVRRLIKK